jgi:hypothetical protein
LSQHVRAEARTYLRDKGRSELGLSTCTTLRSGWTNPVRGRQNEWQVQKREHGREQRRFGLRRCGANLSDDEAVAKMGHAEELLTIMLAGRIIFAATVWAT